MASLDGNAQSPIAVRTGLLANTPTGDTTLFTITGPIRLVKIVGVVSTTAMAAAATGCLLKVTVDALAATDICAVLDLTGATVGTQLSITGTFADNLIATAVGVAIEQADSVSIAPIGTAIIELENAGAANAGQTFWCAEYVPTDPAARMIAAF